MTAKNKAEELFNKYSFLKYCFIPSIHEQKQCAIIAFDEILLHEKNNHSELDFITDYWKEVKQEIEKL